MSGDRQLHLDIEQRLTSDSLRREVILKADSDTETIRILYEIYDTSIGDLLVLDGMVQGVLLHCMKRGLPLRIHGNLSNSAAYNLHEFQRVWALWKPSMYRHIDLIPDAVVADRSVSDQVIQAFSGGVDANFTLLTNKQLHKEQGGYDIKTALLVHGFDVQYDNFAGFDKLLTRVRKAVDLFGVDVKIIRTNSRMLNIQSWMDSNSAQLAACLHQFSNQYGRALIGSGEPYDALCLPTGSNPFTDPLLSGNLMTVIHDGAGFSRTEKVAALCKFPALVDQLKVCWEGAAQHENCGRCEKCLRTRLNFAAAGDNEPSCFPGRFDVRMLRKLRAKTALQIVELETILTYVKRRRLSYPWLKALRRQIMISRLAIPIESALRLQQVKRSLRQFKQRFHNRHALGLQSAAQESASPTTGTFVEPSPSPSPSREVTQPHVRYKS